MRIELVRATLAVALNALLLGCSNPYERDNPMDPIHTYKITFTAPDATGGTPPAAVSGSYGDAVTLPSGGNLVRSMYIFGGWADDGNSYNAGFSYTISGSIAMQANWLPAYTVNFDGNGATSGTPPAAVTAAVNTSITLPDKGNLEKSGYIFNGWTSSGGTYDYRAGSSYYLTNNVAVTLYAKWRSVYTVTFDGNGATSGTPPEAMEAVDNYGIELPDGGSLARSGYALAGWNTNSSGTGTNYNTHSWFYSTSDTTLYAKWIPGYTVTFDGNGATSGTSPAAIAAAIGSEIQLPAKGSLARNGYLFSGWNTDISGIGTSYDAGSFYAVKEDIILYAMWVLCSDSNSETYFCDTRDTKGYRTTSIGEQVWMAENLNYNASGSKCYDNLDSNCDIYGRLYSWETAKTACPSGWHLPTYDEWVSLGDSSIKLRATRGWDSNGNGTDELGFSALPGGGGRSDGSFDGVGSYGNWWSADGFNNSAASFNMQIYSEHVLVGYVNSSSLYSIRCLKN